MSLHPNLLFGLSAGGALFAVSCGGQIAAADAVVPDFWFPEPTPALVAAAESGGVILEGLERDPGRGGLVKGDKVTLLIEHIEGSKRRQWVVVLVGSELSEKDRALPSLRRMRIFTSTGNEITFTGTRAALAIHVLGPVLVEATRPARTREPPQDVWSGALVSGEFLQLGFARAEATWLRLRDARLARDGENVAPFTLSAHTSPFPEATVAEGRKLAASEGLTLDDEQALLGGVPALIEFFGVASRTPGVNDIMKSVIDIPIWSIVARGGRVSAVSFHHLPVSARIDPSPWGLTDSIEAYERAFLMKLNGRTSLCVRMAVVPPHPPLVASAGIVGFAAGRPDGKGPRLMIRLIASRLAPESGTDAARGKN